MAMDQSDCITLIYELPQKKRDKGIKLFVYISSNIINNPNEPKWRFLYYDKIYIKFMKCDEFIQLLLFSGFKLITKPKKILKFNNKYIGLLQKALKSLKEYKQAQRINAISNNNNNDISLMRGTDRNRNRNQMMHRSDSDIVERKEIEYDDNKYDGSSKDHVRCICGNKLLKTTPLLIYGKEHEVLCDNCFIQCKSADIIYHCSKGTKCSQHIYGYDLCDTCVSSMSHTKYSNNHDKSVNMQQLEQFENKVSMIDIDIK